MEIQVNEQKFDNTELYEKFKEQCKDLGCELITTEDELNSVEIQPKYKNLTLKIKMSCGHVVDKPSVRNLFDGKSKTTCPPCSLINANQKLKDNVKNIDGVTISALIEKSGLDLIRDICKTQFEIVKTHEGCEADILVRPVGSAEDLWLSVQLKVSNADSHTFTVSKIYDNSIILLIHVGDKKMWILENTNLIDKVGKQVMRFGKIKSIYDVFSIANLSTEFEKWYKTKKYNITFEKGSIPKSESVRKEYEMELLREKSINFLTFEKSEIDGLVYDFKIGNLKVQEKNCHISVIGVEVTALKKSGGKDKSGKKTKASYSEGDNDVYWINSADKNIFYVVPESVLIEKGFIATDKQKGKKTFGIRFHKWLSDYKFKYKTINEENNKKKLLDILKIIEK